MGAKAQKKEKKVRGGRLSRADWVFIERSYSHMTYEEMAAKLNKRVKAIQHYVEAVLGENLKRRQSLESHTVHDLRKSDHWPEIQKQFSKEELKLFLGVWGEIAGQFKNTDIYSTEKIQIIDVIKLEVLMNRNLSQDRSNLENIRNMEKVIEKEKTKSLEGRNHDQINNLEQQIMFARNAQESMNRSYREMGDRKNKLWTMLRATRSDRIKEIEESKKTFAGFLAEVTKNPTLRQKLGISMEKHRLAAELERKKLEQLHTYGDGQDSIVDIPLLTPELIIKQQEEEKDGK